MGSASFGLSALFFGNGQKIRQSNLIVYVGATSYDKIINYFYLSKFCQLRPLSDCRRCLKILFCTKTTLTKLVRAFMSLS